MVKLILDLSFDLSKIRRMTYLLLMQKTVSFWNYYADKLADCHLAHFLWVLSYTTLPSMTPPLSNSAFNIHMKDF